MSYEVFQGVFRTFITCFDNFKYDSKHFVNFRGDQIEANEIGFDTDFSSIGPKRVNFKSNTLILQNIHFYQLSKIDQQIVSMIAITANR